jgi:hypothetical protein
VEKGHGYLRLTNDEYFIGGWIEVGQKLIQRIEEDMLLVVPEGSYEVFLSNDGIEGSKQVTIARDQEVELDVSDLRTEDLVKYGNLIFTLSPETASVYLDGVEVDTTRTVKTEYGLHQIMAKADGYETVIQYIKVSQESANVSITLDEEKDRTVSGNSTTATVSDNSTTTSTGNSTGYKVTLESPTGAEAYVDGNYVGVIPVSFSKTSGSHVISIRKTGYVTRSYTIDVDDEEKDISFSFSDLTAEE